MSAPVYEFESSCRGTLTERWRVAIPDGERLSPEDLADRLRDECRLGECELIDARFSEPDDRRELIAESIEVFGPEKETDDLQLYTVVGVLSDSRDPDDEPERFNKLYASREGFRVVEALARREHPTLAIAGVVCGEVAMADVI